MDLLKSIYLIILFGEFFHFLLTIADYSSFTLSLNKSYITDLYPFSKTYGTVFHTVSCKHVTINTFTFLTLNHI